MGNASPDDLFSYWICFVYNTKTIKIMNRELLRFFLKILIVSVILALAGFVVFYFFLPGNYLPVLHWMLLLFMAITIASYAWQLRLAKKDMGKFIRSSMVLSVIRLFLYSAFAIIYLALNNENAAAFVVSLVVVYMAFTFIEVTDLARITRR